MCVRDRDSGEAFLQARERIVEAEATGAEGILDAVTLMNILSPRGKGERRAEAVKAAAPKRQQTLDDYLFAKSPKESNREALMKLSAGEIDDMLGAMDRGPGVDVREGPNKEAFDIMRMKRGLEAGGKVDETGALTFDYSERPAIARPSMGRRKPAREEDDVGTLW